MIALELPEVKAYMSKLLLSDTFDRFLLIEGEIKTFSTFTIDGYLHKEFYTAEERELLTDDYALWEHLREYCLSIIKGKRTPLAFKLVFSLSKKGIEDLLQQEDIAYSANDVQGLYLNFKYDGTNLQCITGISMKSFTMDKSLEQAWDKAAEKLLGQIVI